MRVGVVAMETSHHRETEGRERLERVAKQFADAGHEVRVFCSQWWEGQGTVFEPANLTYHGVTETPSVPSFCIRLPFSLARYHPDVIYTIPDPPSAVIAASVGGTLARAPLVINWYGDESLPNARRTQWALREPECIVTPSEMVRTHLREQGAIDDRTTIIPESIDMDLVRETDPAEEVDVVYAHPLDESANIEAFFLGLAELRQKDWSATIIGDGPERETYEQEATDLRIDDRIEFVGACDREKRVSIYKGAHVFVQTAYREYFATELLWALACGCLGIVEYQAKSSAHELVEHRERAFRVTNPQEIADTVVGAADYERMSIDESLTEFDHNAVRGQYETLFERLIDEYGIF